MDFVTNAMETINNGEAPGSSAEDEYNEIEYLEEVDPMIGVGGAAPPKELSSSGAEAAVIEKDPVAGVEATLVEGVEETESAAEEIAHDADEEAAEEIDALVDEQDQEAADEEEAQEEAEESQEPDEDEGEEEQEDGPTSSVRARSRQENQVDEEQCRVCTTKESLVSLFQAVEKSTPADMLMVICPTVNIAPKDFMPQFICNTCLNNVQVAIRLKTQCETTEQELRKKLSRSKNKIRRPPQGYIYIDAPVESESEEEEEEQNDEEFKVSDADFEESPDSDSDDSDLSSSRRKRSSGGSRRKRSKSASSQKKRSNTEDDDSQSSSRKKKRISTSDNNSQDRSTGGEFVCEICHQAFTRKQSYVLHRRSHYTCEICNMQFNLRGAYRAHMDKHKNSDHSVRCSKCGKICLTKGDYVRHMADAHNDRQGLHKCQRCNREFVSSSKLKRHKETSCSGTTKKKKSADMASGKDLFKSVAPLTTTYWSDSFSD